MPEQPLGSRLQDPQPPHKPQGKPEDDVFAWNLTGLIDSMPFTRQVRAKDKLRLVMLYMLRYERHSSSALDEFIETLTRMGVRARQIDGNRTWPEP
jgi:hypothetical protein